MLPCLEARLVCMAVNSARIVSSPSAKFLLWSRIIHIMDARVVVVIVSWAILENYFIALIIFTMHLKNGQSSENNAKSKFAKHLSNSMNSSAVCGILGDNFFFRFAISCMVTVDAQVRASLVSFSWAISSSSRSKTMNGDRPSLAFNREGRLMLPSFPSQFRLLIFLTTLL